MSSTICWKKNIRKASYVDVPEIRKHLLSLDNDSIKGRFGNIVTRAFLQQYIERIFALDSVVLLCEFDGFVRGIGEIRPLTRDKLAAEITFTVDSSFRDLGIGTALMAAAIDEASRKGVQEVFSCFDAGNRRMARIAEKFRGDVACDDGACIARIVIDAYPRFRRRAARLASAVRATGLIARASEEFGRLVAFARRAWPLGTISERRRRREPKQSLSEPFAVALPVADAAVAAPAFRQRRRGLSL